MTDFSFVDAFISCPDVSEVGESPRAEFLFDAYFIVDSITIVAFGKYIVLDCNGCCASRACGRICLTHEMAMCHSGEASQWRQDITLRSSCMV